jgi:glyceraldehyde-3-phosphate dehydrogenase/erythrose-4-phosphate dehydrogenase
VTGKRPSARNEVSKTEIRNVPCTTTRATPKAKALDGTMRFTIPDATIR